MLPPSAQGNDEAEHPLMAVRQLEPSARLTIGQVRRRRRDTTKKWSQRRTNSTVV